MEIKNKTGRYNKKKEELGTRSKLEIVVLKGPVITRIYKYCIL